jgi:hypothetical protein
MKVLNVPLGLLFSFQEDKLVDGTSRVVLPAANKLSTEARRQRSASAQPKAAARQDTE